jgi:hypothetical protein
VNIIVVLRSANRELRLIEDIVDGETALMFALASDFSWKKILIREPIQRYYGLPYSVYFNFIIFN